MRAEVRAALACVMQTGAASCEVRLGYSDVAHLTAAQDLIDRLAGMTTDDEMGGDMSGDDAAETLSWLISAARQLSERRPVIAPAI